MSKRTSPKGGIDGDITVPAGQTLTIEPGVEVLFQDWYGLTVNGTLQAVGTESEPILFGGGHPTAGWVSINIVDAPDGSQLTYVIVENASHSGIYIENNSPLIIHRWQWHAQLAGGQYRCRSALCGCGQRGLPITGWVPGRRCWAGVTGVTSYSGPTNGQASGTTGAYGTVTLTTKWKRDPNGTWCFEVTDVAKDGYSYNPSANVVTLACE